MKFQRMVTMNKVLFCFLFLVISVQLSAQYKHDYNWLFGYQYSSTIDAYNGSQINFDNNEVTVSDVQMGGELWHTNAMISDENGNLLFYTNGCNIYDVSHQIMENGNGLNPGPVHDEYCIGNNTGYSGGRQSIMILPVPLTDSLYYLFHKGIRIDTNPVNVVTEKLYFSIVDMKLNEGNGAVVEKNQIIIENDSLTGGEFAAVKHENGYDWWVISPRNKTNEYHILLLTENGIESVFTQQIGDNMAEEGQATGQVHFSPDGQKYIRFNAVDGIFIFDFNRTTGELSNYEFINHLTSTTFGGMAISPNSRFLYVNSLTEIHQYDLEAENIANSKILVALYDDFVVDDFFPTNFFSMQLAPDCRIYINSSNGVPYLHYIDKPDEAGEDCEVKQHALEMPYPHLFSMPYFPNYRLDTDEPTCVPVINTTLEQAGIYGITPVNIYPNPANDYMNIVFGTTLPDEAQLTLYNALGQVVMTQTLRVGQQEFGVDISLATGVYHYIIQIKNTPITQGHLTIIR